MGIVEARQEHQVVHSELVALLHKHAGHLPPIEILAVAANMLGKLIALQDRNTITPQLAMDIVMANIEKGNQQIAGQLIITKGRA